MAESTAGVFEELAEETEADPFANSVSFAFLVPATGTFYRQHGKRALDLIVGVPLLILSIPVLSILVCLLALSSGRPIFYSARRVGKDGSEFEMLKLRTMVHDAELVLARWRRDDSDLASQYSTTFKLKDDPRIMPLGRFLRRTSLDELPQLWNVVRGEMSLVGPRPVVREELSHYGTASNVALLLSSRPGITGRWQVEGRNTISYPQRAWIELEACLSSTLASDIAVLVKTIGAVLRLTGR